ncbi:salicylate 1-monooxygenase [Lysobacteraceae bacterium NML93-0792]|nr:salicylate 1-monooxygenase [Xanthomonadaceae bacterium NML93-0792]PBS16554.1 salicylate 1-monooxygenase [Xanthomonadaceae bacterium NML93-0793]PBS19928.1 salicylate 1-monooxygenase [Xanthomonadaceae bacterium NML93-0831]
MSAPVRVAIVGGGIAGVGLALGLKDHAHLDVKLFESARAFGEIGAGVSFGANAVRAITGLGMGEPYAALADHTPDPWRDIWFEWRHSDDARLLGTSRAPGVGQSSVHRADFLDALATRLPMGMTQFNKRATRIEHGADSARVHFADGTDHEADIVIASDGIKSNLRDDVLRGLGQAPVAPRFTGTCAYRGMIESDRLRRAFEAAGVDTHLIDVPQMILGLDAHILSFPVKQGRLINVVAFVSDRSDANPQWPTGQSWVREASRREMLEAFAHWGVAARTLLKCIDTPTHWALHELAQLHGYVHGRLALIGDAAHAMLPHQGAGAGQGLEDAYFFAQLLADPAIARERLPELLAAYDAVRRPRACRVQQTSWEAGELYELRDPRVGDEDALLGHTLETRFDWIWNHDLDAEVATARARIDASTKVEADRTV